MNRVAKPASSPARHVKLSFYAFLTCSKANEAAAKAYEAAERVPKNVSESHSSCLEIKLSLAFPPCRPHTWPMGYSPPLALVLVFVPVYPEPLLFTCFCCNFVQLLIDGKWVPAASGETFPNLDPRTGETICHVAEAGKEDVDRAVAAAKKVSTL